MAERRVPLCSTKGCPHPSDPDWHRCFIDGKQPIHHQHWPKLSQAGKGARIVAALCPTHHDKIDNGLWTNGVHQQGGKWYYWVLNEKGQTVQLWMPEGKVDQREIADPQFPGSVPVKRIPSGERIIEAAPEETPPHAHRTRGESLGDKIITFQGETVTGPQPPAVLSDPEPSLPAVQYHATGLQLPENLTRDQWEEIAGTIQQMIVSAPWWVGDVLVYGQRYGEEMWQAIKDRGGANYEKLRKYMWVAEKVSIGTRVPALKWSHHREVADLEPDEQKAWLQRAQDESMAVNELRLAIKGDEPPDVCPESANGEHDYRRICRHCGKER